MEVTNGLGPGTIMWVFYKLEAGIEKAVKMQPEGTIALRKQLWAMCENYLTQRTKCVGQKPDR